MMGKAVLTDIFKSLKMDKDSVDTKKGNEYLAVHKKFRSDSSIRDSELLVVDKLDNKIFCVERDTIENLYISSLPPLNPDLLTERSNGLKKLADEIENNTDLICELEYLIRSIPVRETKHSIHLILQHLRFSSEIELITAEEQFIIRNDTPLLAVGCYFQSFKLYEFLYLYATNETAIICHLFTELCENVGLNCLKLVIVESRALSTSSMKFPTVFQDVAPKVIGIITEKSDVDSAVDIFLNSERHPFPLSRIFVQESVYKDFKDIIAWKCKSEENKNISYKSKCTDAFKYRNKIFYLDYAGNTDEPKHQNNQLIYVEAFRTINELLSLINKSQKYICSSVWASSVSEANEIALNLNVPIIWINDYCKFDGPSEISQAIFDKTYDRAPISTEKEIIDRLSLHQKTWVKQTFNERYEKVMKSFEMANQDIGNALKTKADSFWKYNNFVELQDKTIVLGFKSHMPLVSFYWSHESDHDINHPKMVNIWLSIAKVIVNGSAVGYRVTMNEKKILNVLKSLEKFGLPLAEIERTDSNFEHMMTYSYCAEGVQTKVIWTNFGTTFAN